MIRILCLFMLALASPLAAEVVQKNDDGFEVSHTISVNNSASEIHRTLTDDIGQWWVGSHTYSGDPANLYVTIEAGGGFYEKLADGGFVEHLRLLYAAPRREYRWEGALGPLQSIEANGRLTWTIKPVEDAHSITFIYKVWGNPPGGLSDWAGPVDGMMKETITSLEKRLSRD